MRGATYLGGFSSDLQLGKHSIIASWLGYTKNAICPSKKENYVLLKSAMREFKF